MLFLNVHADRGGGSGGRKPVSSDGGDGANKAGMRRDRNVARGNAAMKDAFAGMARDQNTRVGRRGAKRD